MTTELNAPEGEGEPVVLSTGGEGAQSVEDAVANIRKAREKAYAPPKEATPPKAPKVEPQVSEPPQVATDDAAPPPEAPGEVAQEDTPAEEPPPIDPPRSWSKEDKELFATLPRETQERIAEKERARESDFLRRQQEVTEKAKAAETERTQAEQARINWENQLPATLMTMQGQVAAEFPEIKTPADVERLLREDPFRYQRFDFMMKQVSEVKNKISEINAQRAELMKTKWNEFATNEANKFYEKAPELKDPVKYQEMSRAANNYLKDDLGFTQQEIDDSWNGKFGISMRDHRFALMIRDGALYRQGLAKAAKVRQAPIPPVQKPGAGRSAAAVNQSEVASLIKQLETATGRRAIDLAVRLRQARRGGSSN